MINLTDNLYRTQWLDLVFQNRNKAYGAYSLRQNNSATTARAFFTATGLFIVLIMGPFIYQKMSPVIPDVVIVCGIEVPKVNMSVYKMPAPAAPEPPKAAQEQPKLKTIRHTPPVVVPAAQVTDEPATLAELNTAVIESFTADGDETVAVNAIESGDAQSSGQGNSATGGTQSENSVYEVGELQQYPEFPGGQSAFAKYLSRNLKYPGIAVDSHVEGKILVSFIVEKDGTLSSIKILRGIGFGCDEEAIRVLKKSPRWTPGEQNKQRVRVAYTLPINFQLPD